jgi:pyridoxal phosphate enzyme (YggS family)
MVGSFVGYISITPTLVLSQAASQTGSPRSRVGYWSVKTAMDELADRLAAVRTRIARAAERARRDPAQILLLAVTKIFPAEAIQEAYALGLREFGENYVQEFEAKAPLLSGLAGARYHLIGHLQSNKAAKAAELFQVVQTVDSAKLARRLNDAGRTLDVMLEVKLSDEQAKSGVNPDGVSELIEAVKAYPNLRLRGLMTMPPWSEDPEAPRGYFRRLRELAEAHNLNELSMGMSNDLETAIEEGSTCVRVGTALFGKRRKA